MSAPRAKVLSSLAAAGRPQMWANEQESAALSGLPIEDYRARIAELEACGFPPVNRLNGKRPIPAILAFWGIGENDSSNSGPARPIREYETFRQ